MELSPHQTSSGATASRGLRGQGLLPFRNSLGRMSFSGSLFCIQLALSLFFTQGFTECWDQQYGTAENDVLSSVALAKEADEVFLYTCGWTRGDFESNLVGLSDAVIARNVAKTGAVSWARQLGVADSSSSCTGVAALGGNVAMIGNTDGPLVTANVEGPNGSVLIDAVIYLLDGTDGATKWAVQLHTDVNDEATGVAFASDGDVLVAGHTSGSLRNCSPNACALLGGSELGDVFVGRLAGATGAVDWMVQFGSADEDTATAVEVDDAGNVFVSGFTNGDLAGAGTHQGLYDSFVCKLDGANGDLLWCFQKGTAKDDRAFGLAISQGVNPVVCGQTQGSMDSNSCNAADSGSTGACEDDSTTNDLFCFMLDGTSGSSPADVAWLLQDGTEFEDVAEGVAALSSSELMVVGSTRGNLYGTNSNNQWNDAITLRVSSAMGEVLESDQRGSTLADTASAVGVLDGELVWVGATEGDAFGENAGGTFSSDFIVLQLDARTDVEGKDACQLGASSGVRPAASAVMLGLATLLAIMTLSG
ncbi:unnamed protein product [Chrysoparadoxa australica]